MERVDNIADFISKFGAEGIEYDSLLEMAEQLKIDDDISYESTDQGRIEFGKLLYQTRRRLQIRNPYSTRRDSGASRKHDGRQLSLRTIARDKFVQFIQKSSGVKLSADVLRKAETGESINDETLFKIATARFVLHPGLDRALELSEMIDILREETTIADLEKVRPSTSVNQPAEAGSRSRRRRSTAP